MSKFTNYILQTRFLVYGFFIFQFLSLFGRAWPGLEAIVFWLLVGLVAALTIYRLEYGLLFLLFEFLAGHEGHCFSAGGVSLRLALFLVVMAIWLARKISKSDFKNFRFRKIISLPFTPLSFTFLAFLLVVLFSLARGCWQNNYFLARGDFVNYAYLFLIFPLSEVIGKAFFQKKGQQIIEAGVIGISFLTIIVFFLFATNLVAVHDQFYWWWRQTVFGKATLAGNNFFRIVSSAHLLILPLFLVFLSFLIKPQTRKKKFIFLALLSGLVLVINFSRAYFLGIFFGLLFLLVGVKFKKWLPFALLVVFVLVFEFSLLNFFINQSSNVGYFQERMKSIATPEEELSAQTRLSILPSLVEKIKANPFFGEGLGSTVSYINPLTQKKDLTSHVDWGYLEIWLENGFLGLSLYVFLLFLVLVQGYKLFLHAQQNSFSQRFLVGLSAGLIALMVATLTGPYLFHALGIFYLVGVIVIYNYYEEKFSS
jgi:O-antigen ligase